MSELPYRLCAIDLDETLLNAHHEISPRNERAVRSLVERGVIVVVASGRMFRATARYVEQLGLNTPVISYNGAMVKHPRTGEVWLEESLTPEVAVTLMDYCAENALQLNFYLDDNLYTAAETPWIRLYHERTGAPYTIVEDFNAAFQGKSPTKLIIVDTPERTDALWPHFREQFGSQVYVTKSTDEYLEFIPPTANKGVALALVAERFGVTAAQTLAFGDRPNDLPMIRWAGLGIAVANAKPEVREAADRVTLSNEEDGVAVALEEIFK